MLTLYLSKQLVALVINKLVWNVRPITMTLSNFLKNLELGMAVEILKLRKGCLIIVLLGFTGKVTLVTKIFLVVTDTLLVGKCYVVPSPSLGNIILIPLSGGVKRMCEYL